jgi:hypothetical protein
MYPNPSVFDIGLPRSNSLWRQVCLTKPHVEGEDLRELLINIGVLAMDSRSSSLCKLLYGVCSKSFSIGDPAATPTGVIGGR